MAIDNLAGMTFAPEIPYGPVYAIYGLAMLVPSLAVGVRRLHDVGKSGWFYLISFIPLIGLIWLLVLFFTDGKSESNKWGVNPKNLSNEIDSLGTE